METENSVDHFSNKYARSKYHIIECDAKKKKKIAIASLIMFPKLKHELPYL
jgi:hypothetical protein